MKLKKGFLVASFWKRTFAFLADLLVIDLILSPFEGIMQGMLPSGVSFLTFQASSKLIWLMMTVSAIALLYFVLFEYKMQQTIGKMIFRLQVVSDAEDLKLWQAFGRSLFILPVFPFILLWIIDPIYLIFRKQRLSELLTKTRVLEQLPAWRAK